jgi:hypothetical protein
MASQTSELNSLVDEIFLLTRLVGFRLEKQGSPFSENEEVTCLRTLKDASLVLKRAETLLKQSSAQRWRGNTSVSV